MGVSGLARASNLATRTESRDGRAFAGVNVIAKNHVVRSHLGLQAPIAGAAFPSGLDPSGILGLLQVAIVALELSGEPCAAAYAQMALDTFSVEHDDWHGSEFSNISNFQ